MNGSYTEKRVRKSNIELLRILAMALIIGSHLVGHGIQHDLSTTDAYQIWAMGSMQNRWFSSFMSQGGQLGVALFFVISGYFSVGTNKKNYGKLLSSAWFYAILSLIAYIVASIFRIDIDLSVSKGLMFFCKAIVLPFSGGAWWFLTSYIALTLVSPLLNNFYRNMNKKGFQCFLFALWLIWYVLAHTIGATFFAFQRGLFFYSMGGYLSIYKRTNQSVMPRKRENWGYLLLIIISLILGTVCEYYVATISAKESVGIFEKIVRRSASIGVLAVSAPLFAYSSFLLFERMDIDSNSFINAIAKTTFGVYLFHDSAVFRPLIWNTILKVDTGIYQLQMFPVLAILYLFFVFAVGSTVEKIRQVFFDKYFMKPIDKIDKWIRCELIESEDENK